MNRADRFIEAAEVISGPRLNWKPFPVVHLPEPLRSYVHTGGLALQCDPSMLGVPILAAAAGIIGSKRQVILKADWREYPTLWGAVVSESGTKKSPALALALEPLQVIQRRLFKAHKERQEAYLADLRAWQDTPPKQRGEKPEKPICPRITCQDTTSEAHAALLNQNPFGLLVWQDELSGWLGGFDRYSGAGGADVAYWLTNWSGLPVTVDRKSSDPVHITRAISSVTGGIQPGALRRALNPDRNGQGAEHTENGLLARFIFAMPPTGKDSWTEDAIPDAVRHATFQTFEGLYSMQGGGDDGTDPVAVTLTSEAKEVWIGFHNTFAEDRADLTGPLAAAQSKLNGYAARLALVNHVVRSVSEGTQSCPTPDPFILDEISMQAGIALARWFAHETTRVYSRLGLTTLPESREEDHLIGIIEANGGKITARELMHSSRKYRDSVDVAETALQKLAKDGYGHWEDRISPDGRRTAREFVLNSFSPGNGNGCHEFPNVLTPTVTVTTPSNGEIQSGQGCNNGTPRGRNDETIHGK